MHVESNPSAALPQRRGLTLNPITTMYYIAPASFAFLSIPWFFIEAAPMLADNKVPPLSAACACFGSTPLCSYSSEL